MRSSSWPITIVAAALIVLAMLLPGCTGEEPRQKGGGEGVATDVRALDQSGLQPEQQLGKLLFFDTSLSRPEGMSCAGCHDPEAGFAGPEHDPVSEGAKAERFGKRNSPTAAYASFSPWFHESESCLSGAEEAGSATGLTPTEQLAPTTTTTSGGASTPPANATTTTLAETAGHVHGAAGSLATSFVGGQFWDGRADTLSEQAKGPLLDPLEMNNPDEESVVDKVRTGDYAKRFDQVYGPGALDDVGRAFDLIARAIAAYESSIEVNPFSSKFDRYLEAKAELSAVEREGLLLFTGRAGCSTCHTLGSCPSCGMSMGAMGGTGTTMVPGSGMGAMGGTGTTMVPGSGMGAMGGTGTTMVPGSGMGAMGDTGTTMVPGSGMGAMGGTGTTMVPGSGMDAMGGTGVGCGTAGVGDGDAAGTANTPMGANHPLFTNFGYFNLGVPRNPSNPYYAMGEKFNPDGQKFVDLGLGGMLRDLGEPVAESEFGKFKVPTLRNVTNTAPYMHNGVFRSIEEVIHFYNEGEAFGLPPEVPQNVAEIARPGLTEQEIMSLVAFLETLSDGYAASDPVSQR